MTYDLFIGDRMYSSWSLRGWLMFEKFNIPCRTHMVGLYTGTMAQDMAALAPARLVPAIRTPEGTVIGESLAIAETLAERHPDAGLWPKDTAARATARWLCAEMTAGFTALRTDCPMQFQHCYCRFDPRQPVLDDLGRIETLWAHARAVSGSDTGWLMGDYSLADVFYTPVAARIVGYGLPVSDAAQAYCAALLGDAAVRDWRRAAKQVRYDPEPYALDLPKAPWPDFV
ncbi:glutathione S-transferase [Sedimentitalea nanhaiensis]|uniref:Glutathione S-transferase n=1 Tax=Sedimentitalea nanhaiensis TaxID=999627 RepID=A0A1I6XHR9_9RHOB|nr:glutathione S-transferase [Sedimentitalea nanhaiensis]SFT37582.1 glutathione S-transferase [Sedimentitalea nanhaiensis]